VHIFAPLALVARTVDAAMLIDITPPITPRLAVFPGDTPLSQEVLLEISKGDTVTLSTMRATVHLGAHADAPNHYGDGAESIEMRPLERYIGPCQVIRLSPPRGHRIGVEEIIDDITQPRVLFRTGTFLDPNRWDGEFAAFAPELIDHLASKGVVLIGIDTPSVDVADSKDLPTHKRILHHDMAILEGLVLEHVDAGVYELIALPLPLVGFDASPVRAVLRRM